MKWRRESGHTEAKSETQVHFIRPPAPALVAQDDAGLTPMHMAAGYANSQTLRVLLAAGADQSITAQVQGPPKQVILEMGEYQYNEVWLKRKDKWNRLKKKDPKLVKLKDCFEYLDDEEKVRSENDWDEMVQEVLALIAGPGGPPK